MSKYLLILGFIVLFVTSSTSVFAQQPALIDREIFFGNPEIAGAQISPDGNWLMFRKPYKDTLNIWVKGINEPFSVAKLVTNETKRPISGAFWSRDSKYILFTKDNGGDENFNVYAVNPTEKPSNGAEVPTARNLTNAQKVRAFIYSVPKSNPDLIYAGLNDRDAAWHDLYEVKISTGERKLIRQNTERLTGWLFDNKDQIRLATRSTDKGDTEVLRVEADGKFTKIYSCGVFETCAPIKFHKNNQSVYMQTNKGNRDLTQLVLFDPATQKETLVEQDPLNRVDLSGASFSDMTDELIATVYTDDRTRIYWKNKDYEKDYNHIKKSLGDRDVYFASSTKDEQKFIVSTTSDVDPGTTWLFDRKTRNLSTLYQIREKLDRKSLSPMKPIRYKSSDGLEIPAYLTLPKGVEPKNLPLVVFPHGGPWGRDNWGYNSYAQFLANRGYAVLQPNFRASTGYGKKFLDAGNKQWGDLMQDDITWGVKEMIKQGIADPKRVAIMGGSYGGYATLAGVTFTPDLYAAAVAIVAPSNLITLLESVPPYWESIRTVFHQRMGDPNTPEGKAQLIRQSPLTHADKIKTPLFVVQGANDPRVNKRESDQIVIALRDRNFPVEYMVAPDEGHGFARPVNNMAMLAKTEKFLAKYLGGRFQESMTPEVEKRLAEITVDPKTVTLAKKIEATAGLPKPSMPIKLEKSTYQVRVEINGNAVMNFTATEEVKEENGGLTAFSVAQTPQGEISDSTWLDKVTLKMKKRSINQAGTKIEYEVKDGKAIGTAAGKPITADVGGDVFADGAGTYSIIATLPLAEGYTTTYRNFDVQKLKPEMKQLKVVGLEKVKVPAGEFDAYKVEIIPDGDEAKKETVWIAKDSRKVVKIQNVLPQYGALLISELQ
jgi:dipeptidyl aminopeptidase/acylaminoacyl peptidase